MIEIYEWVCSIIAIDEELCELEISLELNKKELSRWGSYAGGDLAKHQNFLTTLRKQIRLKEVIEELTTRQEELTKQRDEIIELISKFQGLEQQILKMKYIDNLTLESIATETGYSYSYIKSKHAELMRIIRFNRRKGD